MRFPNLQVFLLTKWELKRLWNNFRLSLMDSKITSSYLVLGFTLFVLHISLRPILLSMLDFRNAISVFASQNRIHIILYGLFHFWLVLSIVKGLSISHFTNMFNSADLNILFSAPVLSNEVFISKHLKNSLRRTLIFFMLFLTLSPIYQYINISQIMAFLIFINFIVFVELCFVSGYITYFLIYVINVPSRSCVRKRLFGLFFFLVIIFLLGNYRSRFPLIEVVWKYLPSSIIINSIRLGISVSEKTLAMFQNAIFLIIIYVALLVLSFKMSNFSKTDLTIKETPINIEDIMFKNVFFKKLSILPVITAKDLLLHFRENIITYLSGFIINILIHITFLSLNNNMHVKLSVININFVFYLIAFITIISSIVTSPSTEIFNTEITNFWVLKSSPYPLRKIIVDKYIHCLLTTFILSIPIFIIPFAITSNVFSLVIIIETIITYNVIGLLISVNHSSIFRKTSKLPLISYFIQSLSTLVITYTSIYFTTLGIVMLYVLIIFFIALLITKFEEPIKIYILNLLSTSYLIALIIFLTFSITLLGSNVLRLLILSGDILLPYMYLLPILAVMLKTILVVQYCINRTEKALIERDELK